MTPINVPIAYDLTPVQAQVIAAITGGATLKAAAEAASVHRNTILYWRHSSLTFREVLSHAQYDKAVFIREEAENHVTDAFAAIHSILTKPDVSDSARLAAAKYIIDKASTPPPPKPNVVYQILPTPQLEIVHKNAQAQPTDPTPEASQPGKPETVHSNAQSANPQPVRSAPKVGRNEPCPCGSHLKFKRCCLDKAA